MDHPRLGFVLLLLSACGGGDVFIGGNPDGATDSAATTDASTSDAPSADVAADSAPSPDGAMFNPGAVSGLVLWLDASKGITLGGGAVRTWADQTSFKNDASQPTSNMRPTLVATSVNGLPAVHFDKDAQGVNVGGAELTIADAASLQWGTGDFYVIVVGRFDNSLVDGPERGEGLFFSKTAGGMTFPGPMLVGNVPGGLTTTGPAVGFAMSTSFGPGDYVKTLNPYNDGVARSYAMQRASTLVDLRIDATSVGTSISSGVDISNVGAFVRIGSDANGAAIRMNGDIAEMLAVKGTLATSDRDGIEAYMKNKYAL